MNTAALWRIRWAFRVSVLGAGNRHLDPCKSIFSMSFNSRLREDMTLV